jgi:RNA 2',3'-cyclic 3'-phosphodiesterase
VRLFLGLELTESQKNEIASMLSPLKKTEKGWEHSYDYHLTLLFIGELPEGQVPDVIERMTRIRFSPFTLTTTGFHFFNRRIMYLGFEHAPEIYQLRKQILEIYPEFHGREDKEFVPHLTVKRWQRYEHAELVSGLEENPSHRISIPVSAVSLFKSEKDSENRKYHVISRRIFDKL